MSNHQEFNYKFLETDPWEITEKIIRKKFDLLPSDDFVLIDMADDCIMSHTVLPLLNNNSFVRVKMIYSCDLLAPLSTKRPVLTKSINKRKRVKRSRSSSENPSDFDQSISSANGSGNHVPPKIRKIEENNRARLEAQRDNMEVMCYQKIFHFLEKYALIQPTENRKVVKQILQGLKIELDQLYNLLKYIRNNIDISTLRMNENNLVPILKKIYDDQYLKHDKSKKQLQRRLMNAMAHLIN